MTNATLMSKGKVVDERMLARSTEFRLIRRWSGNGLVDALPFGSSLGKSLVKAAERIDGTELTRVLAVLRAERPSGPRGPSVTLFRSEHLGQERLGALMAGMVEHFLRGAPLHHHPAVDEDDAVGHPAGEAHLVGHHHHGHAVPARSRMTASTSPTSSGSRALVGSSNSISLGSMASARAMATRCCWPPDS